jgi:hypothetical protein
MPQRDIAQRLGTVQAYYEKQKAQQGFWWQHPHDMQPEQPEAATAGQAAAEQATSARRMRTRMHTPLTGVQRTSTHASSHTALPTSSHTALHGALHNGGDGGRQTSVWAKKPPWRTPRRHIERSLVVTGGCTIEPLLARGEDSATSSDDEHASSLPPRLPLSLTSSQGHTAAWTAAPALTAAEDEQVLQALRRRCHHKRALFDAFASLPAREDAGETPRARDGRNLYISRLLCDSSDTESDKSEHVAFSPRPPEPAPLDNETLEPEVHFLIHVYMHTCVRVHIHVHGHIHIHIHIYEYAYTYAYTYIYMYTYIYIVVYVYIYQVLPCPQAELVKTNILQFLQYS